MAENRVSGMRDRPLLVVFTDLDGTLLDHHTYGWDEARPALERCKSLRVPVIMASSKTRAELEVLRRELSLSAPFIAENGGGVFFPPEMAQGPPSDAFMDRGLWKWSLGLPYSRVVKALQGMREELGLDLRGYRDMTIEEISRSTGLGREAAGLSAMREYDEPFMVVDEGPGDREALMENALRRGLMVSAGGRFYHLQGGNDKGRAMEKLLSWYEAQAKEVVSVALGDSPNDFSMLERARHPVLVRSERDFPGVKEQIPRLRVTREKGPRGWNEAVLEILGGNEEVGNVRGV